MIYQLKFNQCNIFAFYSTYSYCDIFQITKQVILKFCRYSITSISDTISLYFGLYCVRHE